MSIKRTMLAAALAAFAFAALPAFASAQPTLDVETGGSGHFTLEGPTAVLTTAGGTSVHCTSVTGTGEFEGDPSTTGTISLVFHGCKSSGTSCGTATAGSGTIETTTNLPFHLVTAVDVTGGDPVDGVLITPKEPDGNGTGHFATFKCAFGLVKVEVKGTGVIGEIEYPETGVPSNTFKVDFAAHPETDTQTYETIANSTTDYDLESKVGNGEWETAVQVGTGTGTFTEGSENTLIKE